MEKRAIEQLIPTLNPQQYNQIKQAESHKSEVMAKSLDTLRQILQDPQGHPYRSYTADVLLMLAHLEAKEALPLLISLVKLPDGLVEDLLGMTLPKQLPVFLYKTSTKPFQELRDIIQDPSVYLYCRTAAMQALVYAVEDGEIGSAEARQFFAQLYTGKEAKSADSGFWDELTNHLFALSPTKSQIKIIRQAMQRGLTAPQYIDQAYAPFLTTTSSSSLTS